MIAVVGAVGGAVGGAPPDVSHGAPALDFASMLFVFMLATIIGIGVIRRVSREREHSLCDGGDALDVAV